MAQCSNCGKILEDGARFCDVCGSAVAAPQAAPAQEPAPVVDVSSPEMEATPAPAQETASAAEQNCPNCAAPIRADYKVCPVCGTFLNTAPAPKAEKKKFSLNLKALPKPVWMGAAIAAAVAVVVILISLFAGGGAHNYGLYIRDGQLQYTEFSGDAFQVTDRLGIDESYAMLSSFVWVNDDGSKIIYLDRIEDGGATLYLRTIGKDKEPTKLDTDVTYFSVNEDFNLVTYTKNGILYQHNLKDKEKIASDVEGYVVSKDGKTIYFSTSDGDYYVKRAGKDKEKVDSDIQTGKFSEDYKTIFYLKEGKLYRKEIGKDKEKLASDVKKILAVYEGGKIHYMKETTEEVTLDTFLDDDLKSEDDAMTEPVSPTYPEYPTRPYRFEYDTTAEYDAAYAQYLLDYENYQKAYEEYRENISKYYDDQNAWREKQNRDELRDQLKEAKITVSKISVCFFDGKNEVKVTDEVAVKNDSLNYQSAKGEVLFFRYIAQNDAAKVKMSEIDSVYDVQDKINATNEEDRYQNFIAIGSAVTTLEMEDATSIRLNPEGVALYYVTDIDEENGAGSLYAVTISGKTVNSAEKKDSDVNPSYFSLTELGDLLYLKDVEEGKGDLYLNGEKLDEDIYRNYIKQHKNGSILYFADWNEEKNCGTLKFYDGKVKTVQDDVSKAEFTPDGEVLYLYDYNESREEGDLYFFNGSKAKKLDEEVQAIVPTYNVRRISLY